MKNLVLSSYSLSGSYRKEVAVVAGENSFFLTLSKLKEQGLFGILKMAFTHRFENLYIAYEDESTRVILPTLKMIGAFFKAQNLYVIDSEGRAEEYTRMQCLSYFFAMVGINLKARYLLLNAWLQLLRLNWTPRVSVRWKKGTIAYLKSNLWFGVKAGGSVGHIAGIVNGFLRTGWPVIYFGFESPILIDEGVEFQSVKLPRILAYPSDLNWLIYSNELYKTSLHCAKSIQVVYQRFSLNNFAGVLLSRKKGIPLIIEYNGSEVWVSENWGVRLRYPKLSSLSEKIVLKHAHIVVTVSEVLREELIAKGVKQERIVFYPNCIDEKMFNPQRFSSDETVEHRKRHGLEPNDLVATFVGTFGKWHGVDFLAHAIRHLVEKDEEWLRRTRLKFMIVGDGFLMPQVKEIFSDPRVQKYTILTGLVDQHLAPIYLASSDILLSPHMPNEDGTRFFGSPTKLFEYMAMGKPIVASDLEQIGEVLREGEIPCAQLYEPGVQESFQDALRTLVNSKEIRDRLSKDVLSIVQRKYTWNHHVSEIINVANFETEHQ